MNWSFVLMIAVVAVLVASASIPLARRWQDWDAQRAIRLFQLRREVLEAKFFDIARSLGKPRGLRWLDCEWSDDVAFARERTSGMLTAFVAVDIRFEAIEGGDMEEVAAVSSVRDAAAVFHFRHGVWGTGGRALFNMNPRLAIEKLVAEFEPVAVNQRSI